MMVGYLCNSFSWVLLFLSGLGPRRTIFRREAFWRVNEDSDFLLVLQRERPYKLSVHIHLELISILFLDGLASKKTH